MISHPFVPNHYVPLFLVIFFFFCPDYWIILSRMVAGCMPGDIQQLRLANEMALIDGSISLSGGDLLRNDPKIRYKYPEGRMKFKKWAN